MIRYFLFVWLSVATSADVFSQTYPVVAPGPEGNYILCGKAIPLGFSYRIERSEAGREAWQLIATTAFKPDSALFFDRLAQATALNRGLDPSKPMVQQQLWHLARKAESTDSLYYYGAFPACLMVVGAAWYDTTAVAGVPYRYRVTPSRPVPHGEGGVSAAVQYPMEPTDYAFKVVYGEPFEQQVTIRLYSGQGEQPAGIRLYRSYYMQGAFEEVFAQTGAMQDDGRMYYVANDTTIAPNLVYQYFAVPYDRYGNPGMPSDTIRIASQVNAGLPVVEQLKAKGDTAAHAMRISWSLPPSPYLQQIRVFRSFAYDSPDFVYIGTASPGDSVFYDRDVSSARTYYYSIVLYGPKGASAPSIRVPGLLPVDPTRGVAPPMELEAAVRQGNRVRLRWLCPMDDEVLGFYVYRAFGDSSELKQVSGLIKATQQQLFYVDSVVYPQQGAWRYMIRSVNKSHNLSVPSDTVRVLSLASAEDQMAPITVKVIYNGQAPIVYWKTPHLLESGYTGFHVYRARLEDSSAVDAERLNADILHYSENMWEDTTFMRGRGYRYWVEAVQADGQTQPSPPAEFALPLERLYAPGNLSARVHGKGVILSWDATRQEGIKEYRIFRSTRGANATPQLIGTRDPAASSFEDSEVVKGQYYFYTVVCADTAANESPKEDWVGVSIK